MEFVAILKDWVIPSLSIFISVWFAASARKDADRSNQLLGQVSEAIKGWQAQLNNVVFEQLNTSPQIIDGKRALASIELRERVAIAALEALKNSDGSPHENEERLRQIGEIAREILRREVPRDEQ